MIPVFMLVLGDYLYSFLTYPNLISSCIQEILFYDEKILFVEDSGRKSKFRLGQSPYGATWVFPPPG